MSGPLATGIPDKVRLIYVPELRPVRIKELDTKVRYRAQLFNPTTGRTLDLGDVAPDDHGAWSVANPEKDWNSPDWVIVLEKI